VSAAALNTLAIVGVGLIGGSFAAALRSAGLVRRVIGVGRSRANLERAVELGVIDQISSDAAQAAAEADLVFVAVPVQQTETVLGSIAPHLRDDAIVCDAGSTKGDVVAAAQRALGARFVQFVPAHPIAGAELSGVGAASASLYRDRLVVLTPTDATRTEAVERVQALWAACGARVVRMDAARHDAVFAAVSHLPHVLAFALVHQIAQRPDAADLFSFAGAGFRDFTRIAGSSPEMWRDIALANKDALLIELGAYRAELDALARCIAEGDGQGLAGMFESARSARQKWLKR